MKVRIVSIVSIRSRFITITVIIIISSFIAVFVVLFLLKEWLQVSDCRTFLITCYVPSKVGFRRESIESCPGIMSKFVFSPLLTVSSPTYYRHDKAFCITHGINLYIYIYIYIYVSTF
jgi:hypothetical protein